MTDYVELAQLRSYLRITAVDDTVDDAELERAISTASAEIDHLCGRTFGPPAEDPVTVMATPYRDSRTFRWHLEIPDLQTIEDLTVHTWTAGEDDWTTQVPTADLFFLPESSPVPRPWTELVLPSSVGIVQSYGWTPEASSDYVKVTGRFGWESIPTAVETATLILAARIFKRRDSPFGMVSTIDGSELSRLTRVMDPDVINALRGYMKLWAVV